MATRKTIVLVAGLLQELNTPTDKIDFGGNTTTDLTEGTNLYYTDGRARGSVSVTDTGGDGSLAYNNTTGVFTYTGPSAAEARAHFSVAVGSGLTYNSTTGEFGTNAIPNSQLANSSLTLGSTSVALGGTASTIAGLTSLTSATLNAGTTLNIGTAGAANSILLDSSGITFEGSVADGFQTVLSVTNPTADRTITLPDSSGTLALLNSISVVNSGTGYGSLSYDNSTGVITYSVVTDGNIRGALSASTTGSGFGSLTYNSTTGNFDFAVVTAANVRGTLSVATGSGLTYNNTTGEFGTSAIPNSQLQNSAITVGTTAIALGSSATTIAGLLALTSDTVYVGAVGTANSITLDSNGITFEGSSVDASETVITVANPTADRVFTIPDETGTAATQDFATAVAIALG